MHDLLDRPVAARAPRASPPAASAAPRHPAGAGRRGRLGLRVAMAVCAIAVLDDAVVHPEPGTSAGDHLAKRARARRRGRPAGRRLPAAAWRAAGRFDRRGEGESQGDFNVRGWGGEADLKAAAGFLSRRPDVDPSRVGGLGLSVGGEMLVQAAAEDRRLRAVVSEGAGARSIAEEWDDPGLSAIRKPFTPMAVPTGAVAVLPTRGRRPAS